MRAYLGSGLGLDLKKENAAAEEFTNKLKIRTPSIKTPIESLSGGNQQKVVLAKSLFTNSEVVIFDEKQERIIKWIP